MFYSVLFQASVSTQSQFRKHLKTRHNKTMDIMGNLIDWTLEGGAEPRERMERRRRKEGKEGPGGIRYGRLDPGITLNY
jgi:hypothetical protein